MIRLYRFLRPYRLEVAAIVLLVFAQTIAQLYLPTLLADIVDNGIAVKNTAYIEQTGVKMLAVAGGAMVCALIAAFFSARVGVGFGRDVRTRIFSRVESFSLREID